MLQANIWGQHPTISQLHGTDISTILRDDEWTLLVTGGEEKNSRVIYYPRHLAMEQDEFVDQQQPTWSSYVITQNASLMTFRP